MREDLYLLRFTTFGQHMFMMAYFGIRPFQITDTGGKYPLGLPGAAAPDLWGGCPHGHGIHIVKRIPLKKAAVWYF